MTPEQLSTELRELQLAPGAATLAVINFRNFKVFNVFAGHTAGDAVIARLQALMGELAVKCWRTGGKELVAVLPQSLDGARETMKRVSWLFYLRFGVTEAWRIELGDGERQLLPFRTFDAVTALRIGLGEIGADRAAALTVAYARAEEHRQALSTGEWLGFAPLPTSHFANLVTLAEPLCPKCGATPEIVDQDLGWSDERCPACSTRYQRHDRIFVEGREQSGAYM